MRPSPIAPWFLVCLFSLGTAARGESWPFGHRRFYPSPERPIGFRADGNGWFPGATPVTEWWPGAPGKAVMRMRAKGNQMSPLGEWSEKPETVVVFTDDKPRNLVWQTKMPGGSMAQPIIVGDRIYAVCDPWWVVCLDMHSGKILWRDALKPLLLDPGDPAVNTKRQTVLELGMAMYYLSQRLMCSRDLNSDVAKYGSKPKPGSVSDRDYDARLPFYARAVPVVQRWKNLVKDCDPDPVLLDALDKSLAAIQAMANGDRAWDLSLHGGFIEAVRKRYTCPTQVHWQGWNHNYSMATPVSDGRQVFVCFGQGQVAAYSLDGQRQWAWRFTRHEALNPFAYITPSPILAGDLLIVRNMEGDLAGIEKATGRIRWQPDIGAGGNHGGYATSKLMRVPDSEGRPRTLIATNKGKLMDAATGAILATYAPTGSKEYGGHGPNIVGQDGVFVVAAYGDSGNSPASAFRIQAQGQTWAAHPFFDIADKGYRKIYTETPVMTDRFIVGTGHKVWDTSTGKLLGSLDPNLKTLGHDGAAIFGRYLIAKGQVGCQGDCPIGRMREDQADIVVFSVIDLADPTAPKVVTTKNYLGSKELPEDYIWQTWLKDVDGINSFVGGYRGITSTFGCANGGLVGQGNRLLALSNTFLYCLGDPAQPYDGPTTDDSTNSRR